MNLFSEIVDRFDYMKINKIPISDIVHEKGFEIIDTIGKNEYFRAILFPDGVNKFIPSVESYEHSMAFNDKLDTYHNYVYWYIDGKLYKEESYMYEDW